MIDLANVRSLSEFQRNARSHIRRLKKTGKPEVLTINGKAEVIIQDAASYQKLLDELDRSSATRAVREGLEQANRNEGRSMRRVVEEIAAKAGIKLGK